MPFSFLSQFFFTLLPLLSSFGVLFPILLMAPRKNTSRPASAAGATDTAGPSNRSRVNKDPEVVFGPSRITRHHRRALSLLDIPPLHFTLQYPSETVHPPIPLRDRSPSMAPSGMYPILLRPTRPRRCPSCSKLFQGSF